MFFVSQCPISSFEETGTPVLPEFILNKNIILDVADNRRVSDGFGGVAMEIAISNSRTLMAMAVLGVVAIGLMNTSDTSELTSFYNSHLEVGKSSSRGLYGCGQYTSARLAARVNNDSVFEKAASAANHTAWDGTTLNYPETTFNMVGGQVEATVGCELLPNGAVASTHTASTVESYPAIFAKYSRVDDSVCSSFIADNANSAWVVLVDNIVVKAGVQDSAKGLYQDGSTVCIKGDGANSIAIYDRPSG